MVALDLACQTYLEHLTGIEYYALGSTQLFLIAFVGTWCFDKPVPALEESELELRREVSRFNERLAGMRAVAESQAEELRTLRIRTEGRVGMGRSEVRTVDLGGRS